MLPATATASLPSLTTTIDSASSTSQAYPIPSNSDFDAATRPFMPSLYAPTLISNVSPLGMDLGEFMLEDDIEFLNQLATTGVLNGMRAGVVNGVSDAVDRR
jgi:hypothetical protein